MSVTTRTLIRHHDAYRQLNKWTPLALVMGTAWLGIVTRLAGGDATVDPWALLATMWFVPALHLVAGPGDRRCRDLLLTLPLSGRRLWLAHLLATGAASGVVLAVSLGAAWAGLAWLGHLGVGDGATIAALREHLGGDRPADRELVGPAAGRAAGASSRPGRADARTRLHPGDRRRRRGGWARRREPGPLRPGDGAGADRHRRRRGRGRLASRAARVEPRAARTPGGRPRAAGEQRGRAVAAGAAGCCR